MYDIKFAFATGYKLVSAAFLPNGDGRSVENQPLYERVPTGYFKAEPATPLEDGDVVLVSELERVTYEGEPVYVLTEENVLYEEEQVYYEGVMVFDFDSVSSAPVNWTGNVVGVGEFTFASGDVSSIVADVGDILVAQRRVDTHQDETPEKEIVVIKNL